MTNAFPSTARCSVSPWTIVLIGLAVAPAIAAEPTPPGLTPGHITVLSGTEKSANGTSKYRMISIVLGAVSDGVEFLECQPESCSRNVYAGGIVPVRFNTISGEGSLSYTYKGDVAGFVRDPKPGTTAEFAFEEWPGGEGEPPLGGTMSVNVEQEPRAGGAVTVVDVINEYPTSRTKARTLVEPRSMEIVGFTFENSFDGSGFQVERSGMRQITGADWRQRLDACMAKGPANDTDLCGCGIPELDEMCKPN